MARKERKSGKDWKFQATAEQKKLVKQMAAVGVSQQQMALALDISEDTLQKHFDRELKTAATEANTQIAGALYRNALAGNVIAQIFWLKTRARWRDNSGEIDATPQPVEIIFERGEDRPSAKKTIEAEVIIDDVKEK